MYRRIVAASVQWTKEVFFVHFCYTSPYYFYPRCARLFYANYYYFSPNYKTKANSLRLIVRIHVRDFFLYIIMRNVFVRASSTRHLRAPVTALHRPATATITSTTATTTTLYMYLPIYLYIIYNKIYYWEKRVERNLYRESIVQYVRYITNITTKARKSRFVEPMICFFQSYLYTTQFLEPMDYIVKVLQYRSCSVLHLVFYSRCRRRLMFLPVKDVT